MDGGIDVETRTRKMKNPKCSSKWTPWVGSAVGVNQVDWATPWLEARKRLGIQASSDKKNRSFLTSLRLD